MLDVRGKAAMGQGQDDPASGPGCSCLRGARWPRGAAGPGGVAALAGGSLSVGSVCTGSGGFYAGRQPARGARNMVRSHRERLNRRPPRWEPSG